jgi:hypothetical protein
MFASRMLRDASRKQTEANSCPRRRLRPRSADDRLWPSELRTPDHARNTLEEFIEHWGWWGFGRAVMEKLGMRYERDVEHAGLPHVLYRLTRER